MKIHEHAIISLGYAAGVSLLAGEGFGNWGIYIAALIGGEIIDFIDHPLYHLVYNRNEPHVKEARKIFKEEGLKSAIKYLNEVEDDRKFKGLLLHNVYSISILAIFCIFATFLLPAPIYFFVGVGAFFLHMVTDLFGDYKILGHVDNWLWVLSERNLDYLGRKGQKLVRIVLGWGFIIQIGFILVTIRWAWQLDQSLPSGQLHDVVNSAKTFRETLSIAFTKDPSLFFYIILGGLALHHINLIATVVANVHKYKLEMVNPENAVPFSLGSIRALVEFIRGKVPRNRQNFERVYLRIQADQAVWIVFLTLLITTVLMVLPLFLGNPNTWGSGNSRIVVFVLTPVFLALLFGTMIHTTVGELGGVWGVMLAIFVNLIVSQLGLLDMWSQNLSAWLTVAAIGSWIFGLLGGIVLRGQNRMSLTAFSIMIEPRTKDNDEWLQDILSIVRKGLSDGYSHMHEIFHGPSKGITFVSMPSTDLMLTPYSGKPVLGEKLLHLRACDKYVPILRTYSYALCENRLTSTSKNIGKYGILPIMPRQRTIGKSASKGEMHLEGNEYHWQSNKRPLKLISAGSKNTDTKDDYHWQVHKSWSEFLDHMVTRGETIQTDIFIFPKEDDDEIITVCGITREYTSTKAYATVEAEAYSGTVIDEICELSKKNKNIKIAKFASTRLFYPRTSFFDIDMVDWVEKEAVLPTESGGFQRDDLSYIQRTISQLPDKKLVLNATADFRKKLSILGVQYVLTLIVGYLEVQFNWWTENVSKGISDFIGGLF